MFGRSARTCLASLLAIAITAAPFRAIRAADDATITVTTKDGAVYRGELVERVPNDHTTIRLATGEIKRFDAKDLADAPASAPTTTSAGSDKATVHLEGPGELLLERRRSVAQIEIVGDVRGRGTIEEFEVVCHAPCDTAIASGTGYRVNGDGRVASGFFTIPAGTHKLDARLGTSGWEFAYFMSLMVGTTALGGGALARVTLQEDDKYRSWSTPMMVGGAVLIVTGLVIWIAGRGSVSLDGQSVGARPKSGLALTSRGFVF